jgi:chromate reductase, NAD(P)H dehydrogenase (quinone)
VVSVRILLVSGSLRAGSTNAAVLRTVRALSPEGVDAVIYEGLVTLPHFNPDDDVAPLPGPVSELRAQVDAASAVVFCTPEYAGALPGSFKNLLDWSVGGVELYEKPVAWINASTREAAHAHGSLRTVLGYISAEIVEDACVHVPVPRQSVGSDGLIDDAGIRAALAEALRALVEHVRTRESPPPTPG